MERGKPRGNRHMARRRSPPGASGCHHRWSILRPLPLLPPPSDLLACKLRRRLAILRRPLPCATTTAAPGVQPPLPACIVPPALSPVCSNCHHRCCRPHRPLQERATMRLLLHCRSAVAQVLLRCWFPLPRVYCCCRPFHVQHLLRPQLHCSGFSGAP